MVLILAAALLHCLLDEMVGGVIGRAASARTKA
jgi:hypothetical protein